MRIRLETAHAVTVHEGELPTLGRFHPAVVFWRARCFVANHFGDDFGAQHPLIDAEDGEHRVAVQEVAARNGALVYREASMWELRDDVGTRARPSRGFGAEV